jgi:glutamate formiminotransferase / formiminotetrahydrofolate cyclodeaminase
VKILECVPNFSEGRNDQTVKQIAAQIENVKGVALWHVDSSKAANRTVVTFAGEPESVLEAAYQSMAKAVELIDMREQKGVHPRIGAVDVCPLVPLVDMTMDECVELSEKLARKVGSGLNLPVYLYAYSAREEERRKLSFIRRGQYEKLEERMTGSNFIPDFGPNQFNARSGATAIGAREVLIAYNINLSTTDDALAKKIAAQIRKKRGETHPYDGFSGDREAHAGLKSLTAIGWAVPEFNLAQVSTNLLDYHWFGLFEAYHEVEELAEKEGVALTGSEVVGLLPKQAMLLAAEKILALSEVERSHDNEEDLIKVTVDSFRLSSVKPFDPKVKILDYHLQKLDMLLNI